MVKQYKNWIWAAGFAAGTLMAANAHAASFSVVDSVAPTPTPVALPNNFNPGAESVAAMELFLNGGDASGGITLDDTRAVVFNNDNKDAAGDGLFLNFDQDDTEVEVIFTYFGGQAGFSNIVVGEGDAEVALFGNKDGYEIGDTQKIRISNPNGNNAGSLLLPFLFRTNNGTNDVGDDETAANNGEIDDPVDGQASIQLGFLQTTTGSLFENRFEVANGSTIALFGDGFGDSDLNDLIVGIGARVVPVPPAIAFLVTGLVGLGLLGRRAKKSTSA